MKVRIKGTDDPFRDIETVEIKGVCGIYFANDVEFETTPDHWQEVRERAAIAILQAMVTDKDFQRYSAQYKSEMAIAHADALVEKLKGE